MRSISTAVIALTLSLGFPSAPLAQYTRQSLKAAMQAANTTPEFTRLAEYFEERSIHFRNLSKEQEHTLREELAHPTLGTKYPTAIDRARRCAEYYSAESSKAHRQSEHFRSLANQASETDKSK